MLLTRCFLPGVRCSGGCLTTGKRYFRRTTEWWKPRQIVTQPAADERRGAKSRISFLRSHQIYRNASRTRFHSWYADENVQPGLKTASSAGGQEE